MTSTKQLITRARTATPLDPPSAFDCIGDIHPGIIEGIDNLRQTGKHKIQQQHKKEIRTPNNNNP